MGRVKAATPDAAMQLMDHVRELRTRLMIVGVVFLLASSLAYVFRQPILNVLLTPLEGQKLVYLNPAGGFNFILLISIYVGLALTSPILLQQLYRFVRPTLPARVQHYSARLFFGSLFLLCAGICFGYFYAIPGALHFLYTFAEPYITASLTADSYLNFIVAYTVGLGIVFQLPLLMLIFHWIKPQKPGSLLRNERWVILLAFLAAAIITPTPDPLNQTIIALPIIGIYQLGVILVALSIRAGNKKTKQTTRLAAQKAAQERRMTNPQLKAAAAAIVTEVTPKPVTIPTSQAIAARRPARSVDGFVARRPVRPVVRPEQRHATPAPAPRAAQPMGGRIIDDVMRRAAQPTVSTSVAA